MFYNNGSCCGRNRFTTGTGTATNVLRPQTTTLTPCTTTVVTEKNCTDCGVTLNLRATPCCARVCEELTYTLTITNNSSQELGCPTLNICLADSLCYMCGTLTIDGTASDEETLKDITLENIPAKGTVTVTFQARIMTTDRYINTYCYLDYGACCCLDSRCFRTTSNIDTVQVCQCCGSVPTPSNPV